MSGNAYGWIRVSSMRPGEEKFSPEAQRVRILEEAERRKLNLVESFEALDVNSSHIARNGTWDKLALTLKEGDTLITNEFTRLGRNTIETLQRIQDLLGRGVHLVALDMQYDTDTPLGEAITTILAALSQAENKQRAERIRQGHLERAKAGKWHGGTLPLGYKYSDPPNDYHPVVDEANAQTIRSIFDLRRNGNSIRSIANQMAEQGLRAKRAKDGKVSGIVIRQILRNHSYIGEQIKNGEVYPLELPPIVDRETWNKVRAVETKTMKGTRNRYLLSGLLICGNCDGMLIHGNQRGVGHYICKTRKEWKGPGCVGIREHIAESLILEQFFTHVESEGYKEAITRAQVRELDTGDRICSLRNELAEAEGRLDHLLHLHLDGKLDAGQWEREKEPIEVATRELRIKVSKAEAEEALPPTWEGDIRTDWETLNLDEKRHALRLFVESVTVKPGRGQRIEINWR